MKIEFDKINLKVIPNFNGGTKEFETRMFVDENNKIFKGKLKPGCSIGLHLHETSSEIIYVLSGSGKVICEGIEERVSSGDCHYCKKGEKHTFINDGEENIEFFAVVCNQ